ncbi:MAG: Hpt domain-containing protein [Flavobacteriales bacterium]|nr:Hpt domain-containing protein [Flavobacteriales bacterium]
MDNLMAISRQNHSFVREILEVYLTSTPKDLDKLEHHVHDKNWEMVRYFAHKLKSSSFTIGFDKGYRIFQTMEDIIKDQQDVSVIPEHLDQAQRLCHEAQVQVKIELSSYV